MFFFLNTNIGNTFKQDIGDSHKAGILTTVVIHTY